MAQSGTGASRRTSAEPNCGTTGSGRAQKPPLTCPAAAVAPTEATAAVSPTGSRRRNQITALTSTLSRHTFTRDQNPRGSRIGARLRPAVRRGPVAFWWKDDRTRNCAQSCWPRFTTSRSVGSSRTSLSAPSRLRRSWPPNTRLDAVCYERGWPSPRPASSPTSTLRTSLTDRRCRHSHADV